MKDKNETSSISLIDAVETLSNIADLDLKGEMGIMQDHALVVQERQISYRTVHWLTKKDSGESIKMVKEIFRVILSYLLEFYGKEFNAVADKQTIEGVKTVMVLVGEAATKLDKYSAVFQKATKRGSVMQLREYRDLQEFYTRRIARKVDEGLLSRWLLALTRRAWLDTPLHKKAAPKSMHTRHVFVDLESVKKDSEYELFFLRKEDGSRFYSPRLIRNIKLVSDFGHYFEKNNKLDDPLEEIAWWLDGLYHAGAKEILMHLGGKISLFYRETKSNKEKDLVVHLNKIMMALMLAANPKHLAKLMPSKTCGEYFSDFQKYLREALLSSDYQSFIDKPFKNSSKPDLFLIDLVHEICFALFTQLKNFQEMSDNFQHLLEAKGADSHTQVTATTEINALSSGLANDYLRLSKLIKKHANGPLIKVLAVLQDGGRFAFDPLSLQDLPSQLYSLNFKGHNVLTLYLPTPTIQEYIHKAKVIEEFKSFLRRAKNGHRQKYLMINLQDRTSWREYSRCAALEELSKEEDLKPYLAVVTLPKDTDFYYQLAPYNRDNHTSQFLEHFSDQLADIQAGFSLPETLKAGVSPLFIKGVFEAIHKIFFSNKNVLTREQRLDFIEIVYFFLELKLLEHIQPDSLSFTCKDGVDIGASASAGFLALLKLITSPDINQADQQEINLILHTPALMLRERVIQPDRFNRMLSVIKTVEAVRLQGKDAFMEMIQQAFSPYFKNSLSEILVTSPTK